MLKNIFQNKFFKSTIILLIGGSLSKVLGFLVRIIITRKLGTEGIGLYSMLAPTMNLLTILAIFSFPIAISKIISMPNRSSKKVIFSIIPISIILNSIIIIVVILIAPFISNTLLQESRLYYPIICASLILPFIGLSSIIKGHFWGRQNMFPYILSNIVEQVVRIIILIYILPITINISLVLTISVVILVNIISETSSIIVMILFMKKNSFITKEDLKLSKRDIKDVMEISIPSTSSKIVGSIAYFFEPIILTNVLLYMGYSNNYILTEYGILNGYALSLLLLPQFFTQSMSTSLIPEVSKNYALGNNWLCKKRIKQICIISFLIGLSFTIVIFLYPEFLLNLLFKTSHGAKYIRILSPFTLLYYIEIPLIHALQAINKAKISMNITITSSILRLILIFTLSLLGIGMNALVITIIINLIFTTYLNYHYIKRELH